MASDTRPTMGQLVPVSPSGSASAVAARYYQARVVIHYNTQSGFNDSGTITAIDDHWVELTKENRERLLIPVASIRIIKLLEPSRSHGDADVLLRPAEGRPEIEQGRNQK